MRVMEQDRLSGRTRRRFTKEGKLYRSLRQSSV